MSENKNSETSGNVTQQIKALKEYCTETCSILENNTPLKLRGINADDATSRTLNYIEGVRTHVETSNTAITNDDNLLTTQFLLEIKENTRQIQELTAYTQGIVHDYDEEIKKLKTHIKIAQDVKALPQETKGDITPQHLNKARDKFVQLKNELHSLIDSLFSSKCKDIKEILSDLMVIHLNKTGNGYMKMTEDNYYLIEMLASMHIVSRNPYNKSEIKLAF